MSFFAHRALAFVGLSLMISACSAAPGAAKAPGEVGKQAPALTIQSLNGKGAVSIASLSGKVAIVEFWATWCEGCKKSLSQAEDLSKRSGGKVEAVGVSVDNTTHGVADFAKAQGVSFPIAWDENHTLMWRWSVEKMPSTYILDAKGRVRFIHEAGKDDGELIAREVAQLTEEAGGSSAKIEAGSPVATTPTTAAASATLPVAAPVPVTDAPPATEETSAASEAAPAPKPKAKPSVKKGAAKKAPKKSAAPSGS